MAFTPRRWPDEKKCEATELNVLQEIKDVTDRVNKAVPDGTKADKASALRRAVINTIEQEAKKDTGIRKAAGGHAVSGRGISPVSVQRSTPIVRLVFAPEQQIAFFGGDPDNFEVPRLRPRHLHLPRLRGRQDGQGRQGDRTCQARQDQALPEVGEEGGDGERSGVRVRPPPARRRSVSTPSPTSKHLRDLQFPFDLRRIYRMEVLLSTWSDREEENRRIAREDLFGAQNSRKAYKGMLASLLDPKMIDAKKKEEARLKAFAGKDDKFKDSLKAWDNVAAALKVRDKRIQAAHPHRSARGRFRGHLFGIRADAAAGRRGAVTPRRTRSRLPEYGEARLEIL